MKDGLFIFDNVVHMYENRPENMGPDGSAVAGNFDGLGGVFSNVEYPAKSGLLAVHGIASVNASTNVNVSRAAARRIADLSRPRTRTEGRTT